VTDVMAAPDQPARDRIAQDLGTTLFVEAGAGSGKTTALVTRVVALVTSGSAELRSIAAITFTEKAGAELRDRVRHDLELGAARDPDGDKGARCRAALDQLDGAAIGTLHSFAQRVLSQHPVEAGLPPRVEVLDEVSSAVAFETRWSAFRDELLNDPSLERTILLLLSSGVRQEALRALAQAFDDNWDLVDERIPTVQPDPPSVDDLCRLAAVAVDDVCSTPCRDANDKLRLRLDDIAARMAELRVIPDELDLLEALHPDALPGFKLGNFGRQASFACDLRDLKARVRAAGEGLANVRAVVSNACAHRLAAAIRAFTLAAAGERRQAGQLEFHDLLVLARSLLRDPEHGPAVRAWLHQHYQRLLLDEFQDTDPIQIELAVRIAALDPAGYAAGSKPWEQVSVEPGHLFVVGDPKQSIYRFRRADITTFLAAAERFGAEGGGVVELTANFRTVDAIIDWVNGTFEALMSEADDLEPPVPSQPTYLALTSTRSPSLAGPPVAVLGRNPHPQGTGADELRAAEAADVAATVARALYESWEVDEGQGQARPARLGDFTILVPSRTSLPFLEDALERAGIAFRAESSSLVYASRAVRDLLMVLRAVDDPTDYLRVVAALRTPLLACGDDDLFRYKHERRGSWSYLAPVTASGPGSVPPDDPVRVGLDYLRSLHEQRYWLAPSELLDRIARDRRALELGFAEGRPRDVWRRLRFIIDQARAWSEATGGNLRQYLNWVDMQTAEGARVAESILPESDDDAVRIMTIHAAKGLEFPITIVSGMSTVPQSRFAAAEVVFPPTGGVGYKFGRHVTTEEYAAWAPIDEQMNHHERIRLLYVACTRARDHLVLSLHRKQRAGDPERSKRTNAELLVAGMGTVLLEDLPDAAPDGSPDAIRPVVTPPPSPPLALAAWAAERSAALSRAARPTAVAATALTDEGAPERGGDADPGLHKRPRDLDLPPWLKGRYGTAVGRAVHGVLQTIDLATGRGLDAAVAAQCEAEAVIDRARDVRALVVAALDSPSVREAAASPHWREVYACTPLAGRLLEGYVDLLYRGPDGLVIVDYKTSATSDPDALAKRVDGYRAQGAAYALVVGAATGEEVARVTFLFLTPQGAVERHLADLEAAMGSVRAQVGAGREVVVD
jgi:ATP-dependent helicase/nuclease subunit A